MAGRPFVKAVRDALMASGTATHRPLVAAVSGGADSMALLEALRQLGEQGIVEVVAAHFNHGLRGAGSDADERFVADWCSAHRVRCVTGRAGHGVPAPSPAGPGQSPEAAARQARYAFLARVQADAGASAVATGHTMDDQAETVLLHLVRGSGVAGLRGMAPVTQLRFAGQVPPITVVRPLLGLNRSDTLAFCEACGIVPRHDPTNEDVTVPRNFLRHRIVPALSTVSPAAIAAIARLTSAARDDLDLLSESADAAWSVVVRDAPPGMARVSRAAFRKLHPALRRRVLMRMHGVAVEFSRPRGASPGSGIVSASLDADPLALEHVDAMLALARGRAGTSLDLPGGIRYEVGYRFLAVTPPAITSDPACPFPSRVVHGQLPVPGTMDAGDGFLLRTATVRSGERARRPGRPSRWTAYLDASLARGLAVRSRERGDRFTPSGMAGRKKLQDFFVDEKVSRSWRDRVPLVVAGGRVAWVVGFRVAEWARPEHGGPALRIAASPLRGAPPDQPRQGGRPHPAMAGLVGPA